MDSDEKPELATITVGQRVFTIPKDAIPPTSALYAMLYQPFGTGTQGEIEIDDDQNAIITVQTLIDYLVEGKVPTLQYREVLSYFGLDPRSDYNVASFQDDYMRKNMYQPGFALHPMNTDPHYGLINLTEEVWDSIEIKRPPNPNLLFTGLQLKKQQWTEVQKSLSLLNKIPFNGKILVAGGRVLSALFDTSFSDIDIFFHGIETVNAEAQLLNLFEHLGYTQANLDKRGTRPKMSEEQLKQKYSQYRNYFDMHVLYINICQQFFEDDSSNNEEYRKTLPERLQLAKKLGLKIKHGKVVPSPFNFSDINPLYTQVKISRTKNSFSIGPHQVILRLYRTPSEILHGFDVDCCSIGYDGQDIWLTQRALHAISTGMNVFSFERMSPSYEWRLAKYGGRGFSVKVPNFFRDRVNIDSMISREIRELNYYMDVDSTRINQKNVNRASLHHNIHQYTLHHIREANKRPKRKDMPLRGLDILLYAEYLTLDKTGNPDKDYETVARMSHILSDYGGNQINRNTGDVSIDTMLRMLVKTASSYPEYSRKYMPFLQHLIRDDKLDLLGIRRDCLTNNFLLNTSIIRFSGYTTPSHCDWDEMVYPLHDSLQSVLHIDPLIYQVYGIVRPWDMPRDIEWKVTNPGEQMTGTFHKTVMVDPSLWYHGSYYRR
jgi:hypothetical protein